METKQSNVIIIGLMVALPFIIATAVLAKYIPALLAVILMVVGFIGCAVAFFLYMEARCSKPKSSPPNYREALQDAWTAFDIVMLSGIRESLNSFWGVATSVFFSIALIVSSFVMPEEDNTFWQNTLAVIGTAIAITAFIVLMMKTTDTEDST